ncbi:MAG: reverse transcriptase family protein [Phototrophicaceae bacterium]
MTKPNYQNSSIGKISSLAKVLSIDEDNLITIANNTNSFYYTSKRIKKANGSFREVYGVRKELKFLQKKILKRIFYKVKFPSYLHGSIKDLDNPRSHITAAAEHQNASILICMDISNFFPSLKSPIIFDIWKRFFDFSPKVADLLTKLTIFNGFLPQGATTSSGLANLAFWDSEAKIVTFLKSNGFVYTRYVDDVIISSQDYVTIKELTPIFSSVFGMFLSKGVKPNRNKIDITTSGRKMCVHNLNINSGIPTIPIKERKRIRVAVNECETQYIKNNCSESYIKLWNSTLGRVNYMIQLHYKEGSSYYNRLQIIKPL